MPLIMAGGLSITPTICLLFANYKTHCNYAIWDEWRRKMVIRNKDNANNDDGFSPFKVSAKQIVISNSAERYDSLGSTWY